LSGGCSDLGRLMDLGLEGKVALVTGGSKGIGFGIAAGLAAEGARVAVAARDRERVRTAAERIGGHAVVFDSDDLDAVPAVIADVEGALGPIDVYVANTGGPPRGSDPLGFSRAQWEQAHRALVLSPMAFLERLLPGMRERGWGRVVAVSSSAVREPIPGIQLSNAHRPGLIAAFKVLARRVAADGVTLNTVLPGQDRHGSRLFRRGFARGGRGQRSRGRPGRKARNSRGTGRRGRVPLLDTGELHHRYGTARRRRPDRIGVAPAAARV
jgi:3-oxoacyl-[acyl-carrier protein] reductase